MALPALYYGAHMVVLIVFLMLLAGIGLGVYCTNPFTKFSVVRLPFVLTLTGTEFGAANHNTRLRVRQAWWWRWFAVVNCGLPLMAARYLYSPGSRATTVEGIIADIHAL